MKKISALLISALMAGITVCSFGCNGKNKTPDNIVADKYKITVATSDGIEQIIIRGQGCQLLSARELGAEVKAMDNHIRTDYIEPGESRKTKLIDALNGQALEEIEKFQKNTTEDK